MKRPDLMGFPSRPDGSKVGGSGMLPSRAFSLIELLVVIAIIGILASVTLPSLKGLGKSTALSATSRQLLDDLAYARLLAINNRTTVYMAFVTPTALQAGFNGYPANSLSRVTNLIEGQFRAYAIYANRSVGSQPGRVEPRYLTDWRFLPDGILFDTNKFVLPRGNQVSLNPVLNPLAYRDIPFPDVENPVRAMPTIAFSPTGQLVSGFDEVLTFMEGSLFVPRTQNGNPTFGPLDITDKSRGDRFHVWINWLTGRAREISPEIP